MKTKRNWMIGALLGIALTAFSVIPAMAGMMGMGTGQTVRAGFTDLPLRECQGTYAGIIEKMPIGQQLKILWNDGDGWANVEVVGTGKVGWVCLANTY